MKETSGWRVVALLVLALIASVGCSRSDGDSSDGGVFASMWDFDEEAPFHNAEVEGILLIEEPCVYVIDDYAWLFPGTSLKELPEPVRIFVNLPRDHTQYDPNAPSIWVHDYGPLASGDRIELVGGGIGPSLPDACSSRVDRAFNVKSVTFKQCALWFEPDHWVQSGCHPTLSDPLAGLWDYDEDAPSPGYPWEGTLLIEEPCVYIVNDGRLDVTSEPRSASARVFIKLPREQTSYYPDSKSIRVHNQDPVSSGDRVELDGVSLSLDLSDYFSLPPDICSANVGRVFTADSMRPKLCDQRFQPDHPSQTGCKTPEVP